MTPQDALAQPRDALLLEVRRGGRFVVFDFCLSFCIVTLQVLPEAGWPAPPVIGRVAE